jgi:hypothetical protein
MPRYRAGVKSRWLLGDLDHLCLRLCKSDRALGLPPSAPSRFRSLVDFMKFHQRDMHDEIARPDDPRPFLYELTQFAKSLSASAARLVRRRPPRDMSRPAISSVQ